MKFSWMAGAALATLTAALGSVAAQAQDSVKIGFITTLTTPASVIGQDMVDAVNLAVEHAGGKIAGKKIEVIFEDDGVKPEVGRQKAEKLIQQDNVDFVTGVIWSNVLLAIRKPVVDSGKFLISGNAGPSPLAGKLCHENFFSTRDQNDMGPMGLGEVLNQQGIKSLYVIAPNFAAGKDMVAGVERTFKGQVLGRDFTKWGDEPQLDFAAELAKAEASGAQALFAFYPGRAGPAFARQYEQSGLAKKIKLYTIYTYDQIALPRLQEAKVMSVLGSQTADWWSPDIDNPANKRFVEDYKKKFGRIPSNYAASSYEIIPMIKAAIEQSGGDPKATDKVREALRKADYPSLRGPYKMGPNHFPIDTIYHQEIAADASGAWTMKTVKAVLKDTPDVYMSECPMAKK